MSIRVNESCQGQRAPRHKWRPRVSVEIKAKTWRLTLCVPCVPNRLQIIRVCTSFTETNDHFPTGK